MSCKKNQDLVKRDTVIYHCVEHPFFISAQNKQEYRKELGLSEKTGCYSLLVKLVPIKNLIY